ncbi:MAG TPA: TIGR01459 family HAD-type hydrolase [Magnetospirillum sp.]|jgi:HAD superfamily hydrolase (TIGR01459 family)|nr:TIGR01459 family HAD-type hydrolase [Magnetospirillum sp.]
MPVRMIHGLSEVAAGFDAFILDLWGVVHDGVEAYPGARDTLAAIRAAGKKTLLLSNAPRRADALVEQMNRMGIGREMYDLVLSSGEAVHMELKRRTDPFYAKLGSRLYHMGPERDENVFQGLDLVPVDIEHADFILNTGPWDVTETVEDYVPKMKQGVARSLPMICANPDHVVIRQGQRVVCAGALAARYAEMGGRVSMRGKPDPAIYDVALEMLGGARNRVLAVGDALHTDIKGANASNIRSIFVTQGIHAEELGIRPGDEPDSDILRQVVTRHGETPMAAIATFRW